MEQELKEARKGIRVHINVIIIYVIQVAIIIIIIIISIIIIIIIDIIIIIMSNITIYIIGVVTVIVFSKGKCINVILTTDREEESKQSRQWENLCKELQRKLKEREGTNGKNSDGEPKGDTGMGNDKRQMRFFFSRSSKFV